MKILCLIFSVLLCTLVCAKEWKGFQRHRKLIDPVALSKVAQNSSAYQIEWFTQTLDHFNYRTQPLTYQQRYLYAGTI
jgi:hypothetical protein